MSDKNRKDEMKGRLKKAAGELTGDEDLKREGTLDKAEGKAKEAIEKGRKAVDKAREKLEEKKREQG